jgi:YebC/PmpR family DNA-binding regulatory protein
MSGHNKWSKIKNKKAVTDARKSKIFGKIVRLIEVEARKAGGDKSAPNLKTAIEKAREVNMPNDNIERAIKKAVSAGANNMEPITYEAYGPGGSALIIETLTDNRNKTAAEIKHILSKNSYSLAAIGSATWAFEKTSDGWEPRTAINISEEDGKKLEALIDEFDENDDVQEVYTNAA